MAIQENTILKVKQFHANEKIMESEQGQQGELSIADLSEYTRNIFGDDDQVISGFDVSQNATPGMVVDISVGMAKHGSDGIMFKTLADGTFEDVDTSIWAIDGLFAILDQAVSVNVSSAHPTLDRIDIVEVRLNEIDGDLESREIIDPATGAISSQNKYTTRQLGVEYKVTAGTAAVTPVAPAKSTGWIKIAEIFVGAAVTQILDADIFNVTARFSGENNIYWTTDVAITFKSASIKSHREQAILDHKDGCVTWEKLANAVQNTITGGSKTTAFWGEIRWTSSSTIVIFPDPTLGVIRVILEDGEVIERSTTISLSITTASNRLDGLSLLNNSLYSIIFYKDSSTGTLEAKFWALPYDVISSATSGGLITLSGTNAKGFSVGAEVVLWKDSNNIDSPYYRRNAGSPTRTVNDANALKITSIPATNQLQLTDRSSGIGINTTYGSPDIIYQVNKFQPRVYSSGNYPSEFESSTKWKDSGIRIRTDGSGNILNFSINGDRFTYRVTADNTWGITLTSAAIGRSTYIPPDKKVGLFNIQCYNGGNALTKLYWESNRRIFNASAVLTVDTIHGGELLGEIEHGLYWAESGGATPYVYGYVI